MCHHFSHECRTHILNAFVEAPKMNEKNIVRMKACIYAKSSLRIDPKEKPYEKIGWDGATVKESEKEEEAKVE